MSNKNTGWFGTILWVDLTTRSFTEEHPSEEIYRQFLGGYGLGVYYCYTRIPKGTHPLSPENILGFCPGLMTGSPAPFTGRYMVCGKSPLTGGWGDANSGGTFGPAIKKCGYDAIFFRGKANTPVYLLILDGKAELRDASDLWGKNAIETDEILKQRHETKVRVAAIGVPGEKQALIAGIVNDNGRVAARSGLGAVMGSKNLKALCLAGDHPIPMHDKASVLTMAKKYQQFVQNDFDKPLSKQLGKLSPKLAPFMRIAKMRNVAPASLIHHLFHTFGTTIGTSISSETGDTPIQNAKGIGYKDFPQSVVRKLAGMELLKYKVRSYGCFACPLQCGAILSIPDLNIQETHRPEYETMAAFGGMILNPDLNTIFQVNDFLNRQGMDTISAGTTIAFVLECVEHGLLKKEDFKCLEFPDGFLPQWNTSDYILPLLRLMVVREGIGNILADGVKVAASKIPGSEVYAMHFNGQELPMHDPRYGSSLLLTYIADPTPGRHTAANVDMAAGPVQDFAKGINFSNPKESQKKAHAQVEFAKFYQTYNACGFCEFALSMGSYPLFEMFQAFTGIALSAQDFLTIGHRIQTLRQMFNAREQGIIHFAPQRLLGSPPFGRGPLANVSLDAEEMIQIYLAGMGFGTNGVPLESTLQSLQLSFCVPDLSIARGTIEPVVNQYLTRMNQSSLAPERPEPTVGSNPNTIPMKLNLSGVFENLTLNEEVTLTVPNSPTLLQILAELNTHYATTFFSLANMKKRVFIIMMNGTVLDFQVIKKLRFTTNDVLSILQPLTGG